MIRNALRTTYAAPNWDNVYLEDDGQSLLKERSSQG